MDPIPLQAPYQGLNELVPIVALESPFCQKLHNFNVTQDGVSLRHGDAKYKTLTMAVGGSPADSIFAYGNSKLFVLADNSSTNKIDIYDVDAGTVAYSSVAASGGDIFTSLYFNKYLFFFAFNAYKPGFYYNGGAYGAIGYTGTGTFNPFGGCVFNARAYLLQINEPAYWYTDINAISGACTKVDLSTIVSENCYLSIIAPFTLSEQTSTNLYIAFVMSNGEVLFYTGSYPDSDSWQIVGRAQIGQPLNFNSYMQYQGDSLVFCDTGVVSLRDLFLKGSEEAASLTVSARIQKNWTSLVQAMRKGYGVPTGPLRIGVPGNIRGVWDKKNDRIIIQFPSYLDSSGNLQYGNFHFVFYNQIQSWFTHQSFGSLGSIYVDITAYKNKVMMCTYGNSHIMVYEKEGATGFADRDPDDTTDVGFDFDIISAPVSNGRAYVNKCSGLDVIVESDLHGQVNYQLIQDFGVNQTAAQKLPSDTPTTLQKPTVDMGIEGSFIQYRIYGTTTTGKSVGYNFWGSNFWVEQGASPR